jgi:mannose-6-phosphate isomerase-like protein (cupin superfamily)
MADVQTRTRTWDIPQEVAKGGFGPVPGISMDRLPGYTVKILVDDPKTQHLIEIVNIEPGMSKYNHWHENAETVTIFLEGEGEYVLDEDKTMPIKPGFICSALPGEVHGARNTGNVPLRYLVVEGPLPLGMREGERPLPGDRPNRVLDSKEVIATWKFVPIAPENMPAQLRQPAPDPSAPRTNPELRGYTVVFLVDHRDSKHMVEIVNIEPGQGKYAHVHQNAETVLYFLEGEGEFVMDNGAKLPVKPGTMCHAFPGEVHGTINKGNTPLRYVVVEGPTPIGGTTAVEVH